MWSVIGVGTTEGRAAGIGAYLMRWMQIPIDFYVNYAEPIFIIATKNRQRLGDTPYSLHAELYDYQPRFPATLLRDYQYHALELI